MMQVPPQAILAQTLFLVRLLLQGVALAARAAAQPPLAALAALAAVAELLVVLVVLGTHHQQVHLKVFLEVLPAILLSMLAVAAAELEVLARMEPR